MGACRAVSRMSSSSRSSLGKKRWGHRGAGVRVVPASAASRDGRGEGVVGGATRGAGGAGAGPRNLAARVVGQL